MNGLTVIVPVYNEVDSIKTTFDVIHSKLKETTIPFEMVAINDGSSDGSAELLNELKEIHVIHHKVNKGYGAALKTGLRLAKFDTICITDADGTYPTETIPKLCSYYMENELDMVVASRTGENVSYPFLKKIPKYVIVKLANYISNTKIPDINSGLRIFNKSLALKYFHLYPDGFSFTTSITMSLLCGGYTVDYYPIDYFQRRGKSKINPIKDTIGFFQLLLTMAMYFSPFKFFAPIIWVFTGISIGVLIRDVYYLQNLTQSGIFFPLFTFLFFSIALLADLIIKRTN